MVVELRAKSQITIPNETVKNLGLEVGDQFEVVEKNGGILLVPVVTYPKAYVERLEKEFKATGGKIDAGEWPVFQNTNDMVEYLGRLG